MGIKGRGRSGTSRDSNPACLCCSSAHLVQCEPDEASSFTNPNVGPGTYASLRLKLGAWSSAVQRGQKCSSPTRRLPSRSWGPIRPRVCSWFRAPIRHECQTAQLKSRGEGHFLMQGHWSQGSCPKQPLLLLIASDWSHVLRRLKLCAYIIFITPTRFPSGSQFTWFITPVFLFILGLYPVWIYTTNRRLKVICWNCHIN